MAKSINRRTFAIGTAALVGGLVAAPVVFAQERKGAISIRFEGAERLESLSGKELREQLVKNLIVTFDGGEEPVEAHLIAVRVGADKKLDVFETRALRVRPGRFPWSALEFPGDMGFPGDMFFPGEMHFPGDMFFPGEMHYPEDGASKQAIKVAQEVLGGPGWFFIVVAAEKGINSSGAALR